MAHDNDYTCPCCHSDLTCNNSVQREYVNKDYDYMAEGSSPEEGSKFSQGHYDPKYGYFEPDNTPDLSGGRYDLGDNSDTCVTCDTQL